MKHILNMILLSMLSFACKAQHTLFLDDTEKSPKASIEDVKWISGYWTGEAFGGQVEEIWSDPLGDSMQFTFKLVNNNATSFYESGVIKETDSSLTLQLKHFDHNYHGWETQNETVDFKLVNITQDTVYFEGLTFKYISKDEMHVYVMIDKERKEEVLFAYKRK